MMTVPNLSVDFRNELVHYSLFKFIPIARDILNQHFHTWKIPASVLSNSREKLVALSWVYCIPSVYSDYSFSYGKFVTPSIKYFYTDLVYLT